MSTNNFKFENILVVLPDFTYGLVCDECMEKDDEQLCEHMDESREFDTFSYNEYIKEIQEKLNKIGFDDRDSCDDDRSYGGTIIAEWSIYDKDDNRKNIEVVVRSGYYAGVNIDYTITEGDYDYMETKTMKKEIDSTVKKLEKVLRGCGTEMLKVAQFSNGEAMYQIKK